ncbi:MAG: cytochrome P450 [Myxococcales bacterium]|nr:cytochrome P450 [Myxococcales bacterium]MCB9703102.1 cytochrome P450 [Myxococcales bacterium]
MTVHAEPLDSASAPCPDAPPGLVDAPRRRGIPIVGPLAGLARDRFDYLEALRREKGEIFALNLPGAPIVLCDPSHAQRVFRDNVANYRKGGGFWGSLRELLGDGIIVSEGDRWLRQRRLMQPQFHRQRIAAMVETVIGAIDDSLRGWPDLAPELDVSARMTEITMQVISRTMFGDHVSQEEIAVIASELPVIQRYTMVGVVAHGLPRWLPVPGRRRFRAARTTIRALVARLVARQRGEGAGAGEGTLLALLSDAVDAETGAPMSDEQVLDEAVGIFLAGYETTALALSWAIYLLMRHPEVMARLREEVDGVLGDRRPTADDLRRLPYARQILMETMRLYPSASWLPRTAVADDAIDGVRIPAGSTVVLPIYLYHRHPGFWEAPERFEPERFADEKAAGRHPFAFIPFGAGQRLCIGKELALVEGQAALAMMAQRFRFAPLSDRPVRPLPTTSLTPQGGIWARASRR